MEQLVKELEAKMAEFAKNANFGVYEDDNIIAIDACTHYSKQMNVIVIEDEKE